MELNIATNGMMQCRLCLKIFPRVASCYACRRKDRCDCPMGTTNCKECIRKQRENRTDYLTSPERVKIGQVESLAREAFKPLDWTRPWVLFKQYKEFRQRNERMPITLFRELYGYYLNSRWWRARRKMRFQVAKGTCERCLHNACKQVHHLSCDDVFWESMEDLLAVCIPCHEILSRQAVASAVPGSATGMMIEIMNKLDKLLDDESEGRREGALSAPDL